MGIAMRTKLGNTCTTPPRCLAQSSTQYILAPFLSFLCFLNLSPVLAYKENDLHCRTEKKN